MYTMEYLERKCALGNSAGGQIAASLLFCTHPKYPNCPRPAWGVLSAPVMNLVQAFERKSSKFSDQRKRTGLEACKQWCPLLNLTQAKPQLLILHGKGVYLNVVRVVQCC